ncbi:hypothetical protein BN128_3260 [Cronobacter sakazakii 696]|nr:hypothetical protein BN128_3260 [Cronobacter sakazakii 696]
MTRFPAHSHTPASFSVIPSGLPAAGIEDDFTAINESEAVYV